uniref:Zgc:113363 n=1 Tax=Sinocyclocheilus grahami TaxID=75366 RepID=A0A672MNF9_SINGR
MPPNYIIACHKVTKRAQIVKNTVINTVCLWLFSDCCAHCILACLFCEVLSWCSAVAQCLACGLECDALCCCGEAATGGLACCAEDTCSALLDCGILEDCCQSSDCLEICLECCSICFPT